MPHPDRYPDGFFRRGDETDDARFYAAPRMVTHIDDHAIADVRAVHAEVGVAGRVLDLMSSWVSHLAEQPDHLTVLGMNETELRANPMADEVVVHDLNAEPVLPFDDGAFDAAVCTVSIDYLTRPFDVVADVRRVLRPGAVFAVTFSDRCFPTKAIAGWLQLRPEDRVTYVRDLFAEAGFSEVTDQHRGGPEGGLAARLRRRDPLWAVHGHA